MKIFIAFIIVVVLGVVTFFASDQKIAMPNDKVLAYYEVFKDLFYDTQTLNREMQYVAVDLNAVEPEFREELTKMINKFCYDEAKTFLDMSFDELKAQGYATDTDFKQGFLITIYDVDFTDGKLVCSGAKWRSTAQMVSAEYTVQKKFWFIKVRNKANYQVLE